MCDPTDQLRKAIEEILQTDTSSLAVKRSELSDWSVGQHLDHLLKVDLSILMAISSKRSFPKDKPKRLLGWLVLTTGFIPRGKAKSPASVAGEAVSAEAIRASVNEAISLLDQLPPGIAVSRAPFMEHPFLGTFSVRDWLRFLVVHHRHHQKIIRDLTKN